MREVHGVKRSVSGSVQQNHNTILYSEPSTVRSLNRTISTRKLNGRSKKRGFTWTVEKLNHEIFIELKGISRLEDQVIDKKKKACIFEGSLTFLTENEE